MKKPGPRLIEKMIQRKTKPLSSRPEDVQKTPMGKKRAMKKEMTMAMMKRKLMAQ